MMYKAINEITHSVEIKQEGGNINLLFTADCGKFGTDEILDEYDLTPLELLKILQKL